MDIFKFNNPTHETMMTQGEIVNDIKRKMWVERYRDAGEFKLIADANTGLKDKLPISSFISHVNSKDVMIVENHEITEERGKEPEIVISGRSFTSFFENRIIVPEFEYNPTPDLYDIVTSGPTPGAIASSILATNKQLDYVEVLYDVFEDPDPIDMAIPRGNLYDFVIEILKGSDLGIKVVRPGPWSPIPEYFGNPFLGVIIHKGEDKSSEINFSYAAGEIERAEYLWSNKGLKNAAVVTGKWVGYSIAGPEPAGYRRRYLFLDASSLDQQLAAAPSNPELATIGQYMAQRGQAAIDAHNDVNIVKAEISNNVVTKKYRTDFNIGDLITVTGNYNSEQVMRVTEYVEIEDETGVTEYPILSLPFS